MRLSNFLDSCMFQWDSVAVVIDGDFGQIEHFMRTDKIPDNISECYVQAWDVDRKIIVVII